MSAEFYLAVEHAWSDKIVDIESFTSCFVRRIRPRKFTTDIMKFVHSFSLSKAAARLTASKI